jgi:hypothetical protein
MPRRLLRFKHQQRSTAMLHTFLRHACWCLLPLLLLSCRARNDTASRLGAEAGAMVLTGEELASAPVLLDALAQRVPTLRVQRRAGECPIVIIRGQAAGRQTGSAAVYVDGTRMRDTCILLQIQSSDVERVELYPVASRRPQGFPAGAGGLILVYRVR